MTFLFCIPLPFPFWYNIENLINLGADMGKHEIDILKEQIKSGKFKGCILKIKINKNNRIDFVSVEKRHILKEG